jgi:hypothetical protein
MAIQAKSSKRRIFTQETSIPEKRRLGKQRIID